jgi:HD-GYP domain-containing protein (c-di-GMP phosphodiesterase class II)/pSer/pThr/pTyr-binding forkhead associated (FHA) protein
MPSVEVVEGADAGRRCPLGSQTYLGRKSDHMRRLPNFMPLADAAVSRLHARISFQGGRCFVEDLNSTNGTELRGERLQPRLPYVLSDGDEIGICSIRLLFRANENERPSRRMPDAPQSYVVVDALTELRGDPAVTMSPLLKVVQSDRDPPAYTAVIDASNGTSQAVPTAERSLAEALKRLQSMVQVSLTLGATTERERLMQKIMDCIFEIFPVAERVLIMLQDAEDQPVPVASKIRHPASDRQKEMAVSRTIIEEVIRKRRAILWRDAMRSDGPGQAGPSIAHLSLRSVMCAPLSIQNEILGLIQVDTTSAAQTFSEEDLQILAGICAQVAIAVKNARLYEEVELLFEGFVRASVRAIESRDPTTAGHSFRVAALTERLARAVDQTERYGLGGIRFTREQLTELRYAALLHDFGKIGVREHVLTKEKKLHPQQMALLRERFRHARASLERRTYRELIDVNLQSTLDGAEFGMLWSEIQSDLAAEGAHLNRFFEAIERANDPGSVSQELLGQLQAAAAYSFPGEDSRSMRLVDDSELDCLRLPRGNLSAEEHAQMQSHVTHTFAFLSLIPWTKPLSGIPEIAYAHHERLDGSGYPRGLIAAQLPVQVRMLSITDIYDALRAGDRPYRTGLPEEAALDILQAEAKAGKIDGDLVKVFMESGAYRPEEQYLE